MGESEEIQYLISRNFAQIQVLRKNARKFVHAKISTNKVYQWMRTFPLGDDAASSVFAKAFLVKR